MTIKSTDIYQYRQFNGGNTVLMPYIMYYPYS